MNDNRSSGCHLIETLFSEYNDLNKFNRQYTDNDDSRNEDSGKKCISELTISISMNSDERQNKIDSTVTSSQSAIGVDIKSNVNDAYADDEEETDKLQMTSLLNDTKNIALPNKCEKVSDSLDERLDKKVVFKDENDDLSMYGVKPSSEVLCVKENSSFSVPVKVEKDEVNDNIETPIDASQRCQLANIVDHSENEYQNDVNSAVSNNQMYKENNCETQPESLKSSSNNNNNNNYTSSSNINTKSNDNNSNNDNEEISKYLTETQTCNSTEIAAEGNKFERPGTDEIKSKISCGISNQETDMSLATKVHYRSFEGFNFRFNAKKISSLLAPSSAQQSAATASLKNSTNSIATKTTAVHCISKNDVKSLPALSPSAPSSCVGLGRAVTNSYRQPNDAKEFKRIFLNVASSIKSNLIKLDAILEEDKEVVHLNLMYTEKFINFRRKSNSSVPFVNVFPLETASIKPSDIDVKIDLPTTANCDKADNRIDISEAVIPSDEEAKAHNKCVNSSALYSDLRDHYSDVLKSSNNNNANNDNGNVAVADGNISAIRKPDKNDVTKAISHHLKVNSSQKIADRGDTSIQPILVNKSEDSFAGIIDSNSDNLNLKKRTTDDSTEQINFSPSQTAIFNEDPSKSEVGSEIITERCDNNTENNDFRHEDYLSDVNSSVRVDVAEKKVDSEDKPSQCSVVGVEGNVPLLQRNLDADKIERTGSVQKQSLSEDNSNRWQETTRRSNSSLVILTRAKSDDVVSDQNSPVSAVMQSSTPDRNKCDFRPNENDSAEKSNAVKTPASLLNKTYPFRNRKQNSIVITKRNFKKAEAANADDVKNTSDSSILSQYNLRNKKTPQPFSVAIRNRTKAPKVRDENNVVVTTGKIKKADRIEKGRGGTNSKKAPVPIEFPEDVGVVVEKCNDEDTALTERPTDNRRRSKNGLIVAGSNVKIIQRQRRAVAINESTERVLSGDDSAAKKPNKSVDIERTNGEVTAAMEANGDNSSEITKCDDSLGTGEASPNLVASSKCAVSYSAAEEETKCKLETSEMASSKTTEPNASRESTDNLEQSISCVITNNRNENVDDDGVDLLSSAISDETATNDGNRIPIILVPDVCKLSTTDDDLVVESAAIITDNNDNNSFKNDSCDATTAVGETKASNVVDCANPALTRKRENEGRIKTVGRPRKRKRIIARTDEMSNNKSPSIGRPAVENNNNNKCCSDPPILSTSSVNKIVVNCKVEQITASDKSEIATSDEPKITASDEPKITASDESKIAVVSNEDVAIDTFTTISPVASATTVATVSCKNADTEVALRDESKKPATNKRNSRKSVLFIRRIGTRNRNRVSTDKIEPVLSSSSLFEIDNNDYNSKSNDPQIPGANSLNVTADCESIIKDSSSLTIVPSSEEKQTIFSNGCKLSFAATGSKADTTIDECSSVAVTINVDGYCNGVIAVGVNDKSSATPGLVNDKSPESNNHQVVIGRKDEISSPNDNTGSIDCRTNEISVTDSLAFDKNEETEAVSDEKCGLTFVPAFINEKNKDTVKTVDNASCSSPVNAVTDDLKIAATNEPPAKKGEKRSRRAKSKYLNRDTVITKTEQSAVDINGTGELQENSMIIGLSVIDSSLDVNGTNEVLDNGNKPSISDPCVTEDNAVPNIASDNADGAVAEEMADKTKSNDNSMNENSIADDNNRRSTSKSHLFQLTASVETVTSDESASSKTAAQLLDKTANQCSLENTSKPAVEETTNPSKIPVANKSSVVPATKRNSVKKVIRKKLTNSVRKIDEAEIPLPLSLGAPPPLSVNNYDEPANELGSLSSTGSFHLSNSGETVPNSNENEFNECKLAPVTTVSCVNKPIKSTTNIVPDDVDGALINETNNESKSSAIAINWKCTTNEKSLKKLDEIKRRRNRKVCSARSAKRSKGGEMSADDGIVDNTKSSKRGFTAASHRSGNDTVADQTSDKLSNASEKSVANKFPRLVDYDSDENSEVPSPALLPAESEVSTKDVSSLVHPDEIPIPVSNSVAKEMKTASKVSSNAAATVDTKDSDSPPIEDKRSMENILNSFQQLIENEYHVEKNICKEAKRVVCDCLLTSEEPTNGEEGCGYDCMNRLLLIECGKRCALGDKCSNKQFQNQKYVKCEVFKTDKKGFGLRAAQNIPSGKFIMEYVGEVVDVKEFNKRVMAYAQNKGAHHYFMSFRSDYIIDATMKGNISRFINHSCDPNSETQKWTVHGELRIGFFAKKDIKVGEEITFDYQMETYGRKVQNCYCESAICRGMIGIVKDKTDDDDDDLPSPNKYDRWESVLEEISEVGLINRLQTLNLNRVMVYVKSLSARLQILKLLQKASSVCKKLFLDYHGLPLIWSWMADSNTDELTDDTFKLELLKTLKSLPITNKTSLMDSKVLYVVEQWSNGMLNNESSLQMITSNEDGSSVSGSVESEPVVNFASDSPVVKNAKELFNTWSSLRDTYRIPKKERIQKMKEHELEADKNSNSVLLNNGSNTESNNSGTLRSHQLSRTRKRKLKLQDEENVQINNTQNYNYTGNLNDEDSSAYYYTDNTEYYGNECCKIDSTGYECTDYCVGCDESNNYYAENNVSCKDCFLYNISHENQINGYPNAHVPPLSVVLSMPPPPPPSITSSIQLSVPPPAVAVTASQSVLATLLPSVLDPPPPPPPTTASALCTTTLPTSIVCSSALPTLPSSVPTDLATISSILANTKPPPPPSIPAPPSASAIPVSKLSPASGIQPISSVPLPRTANPLPTLPSAPGNSSLPSAASFTSSHSLPQYTPATTSYVPPPSPYASSHNIPPPSPYTSYHPPPSSSPFTSYPPPQTTCPPYPPSQSSCPSYPPLPLSPYSSYSTQQPASQFTPYSVPAAAPSFFPSTSNSHSSYTYSNEQTYQDFQQQNQFVPQQQSGSNSEEEVSHTSDSINDNNSDATNSNSKKTNETIRLPPGWKSAVNSKGYTYYYHQERKISQWRPPEFSETESEDDDDDDENDLSVDEQIDIDIRDNLAAMAANFQYSDSESDSTEQSRSVENSMHDRNRSRSHRRSGRDLESTAALKQRIEENFRSALASFITTCLKHWYNPKCRRARIRTEEDFKHLARKMTHAVMNKEKRICGSVANFTFGTSVRKKTRDYIRKYMAKHTGPYYVR